MPIRKQGTHVVDATSSGPATFILDHGPAVLRATVDDHGSVQIQARAHNQHGQRWGEQWFVAADEFAEFAAAVAAEVAARKASR